jgi:hypothetical protein
LFVAVGREYQIVAGQFLQNSWLKTRRPALSLLVTDDSEYHTLEIPFNTQRPRMGLPSGAKHSSPNIDDGLYDSEARSKQQGAGTSVQRPFAEVFVQAFIQMSGMGGSSVEHVFSNTR